MSVVVQHLTKLYGTQKAIDDLTFDVKSGEILGFLGPNGAGKSTTMKIITCFIPQSSGQVSVCGYDTRKHALEVRKHIGYLPEHNPLYHDLYVREYLEFIARLYRLGASAGKRIDYMIEITGLTPERRKKIGQLSKGYRQRVGLAQALLHDPNVLILDEPTSGLDPNQLIEIRNLIRQLGKEKTVIFSTHIMQEVQALCDRVIIIHQGKKVADEKLETLKQKTISSQRVRVVFKETIAPTSFAAIRDDVQVAFLGNNTWELQCKGGNDLREDIALFVKQHNLTLLSLTNESLSLEQIFQTLTQTQPS